MLTALSITAIALISIILMFVIFSNPFIGLAFIAASLPVTDLLPSIPYLSSIIPLLGGVTIVGYFVQSQRRKSKSLRGIRSLLVLGFLFTAWMFISHPTAAWLGRDRNWVLTYAQLLILAFLASELLDTPEKHRAFFWIFSIAAVVSAFVAIQQGSIGEDVSTSVRTGGLSEGANSAGRYFVVGMVFFIYLSIMKKTKNLRFIAVLGVVITFLGVFYTISRTSILLVFTAIGLVILLNPNRKTNIPLIVLFMVLALTLTLMSDSIIKLISSILPSIAQRTDTIGLRFKLWDAAWRMWLDHPLAGVGIGMYRFNLTNYAVGIPLFYTSLVAHSTYFQLLSETGIIGLLLWITMQFNAVKSLWNVTKEEDLESAYLTRAWLIVTLILFLGGITMTQSIEKLLWLSVGVSQHFHLKMQSQIAGATFRSPRKRAFVSHRFPTIKQPFYPEKTHLPPSALVKETLKQEHRIV